MSLSSSALSAIQQAGAAVFTADVELKNAVKEYAGRVNTAMVTNPYHLGNDSMFENWKVVARLSQAMAGIEEELKKVFLVASELTADDGPTANDMPALAAPTRSVEPAVNGQNDTAPTDVKVKTKKRASQRKTHALKASRGPAKLARAPGSQREPSGNPAKLLQYFERVLNAAEFTMINQSKVALETGIPLGSMTAATKKLLESGRLIAGPSGSFKLVTAL